MSETMCSKEQKVLLKMLGYDFGYLKRTYQAVVDSAKKVTNAPGGADPLCFWTANFQAKEGSQHVDYSSRLGQAWYTYRYYLAYVYEYALMYKDVLDNLERYQRRHFNVLSLGSGTGTDYRGLSYARFAAGWPSEWRLRVSYTGVDLEKWGKEFEVEPLRYDYFDNYTGTDMVDFLDKTADYHYDLDRADVVVFPKSLYELPSEVIARVAQAFASKGPWSFYLCIVPPTNQRKYKEQDNRDNWMDRKAKKSPMEEKLEELLSQLRGPYEIEGPIFKGVDHDREFSETRVDKDGNPRHISLLDGFQKFFLDGAPLPRGNAWASEWDSIHCLCTMGKKEYCPGLEDDEYTKSPDGLRCDFDQSPIKNTGYVGYEIYKCTRPCTEEILF